MPKHIVITGADGFLGWHLRCRLLQHPDITVAALSREEFTPGEKLRDILSSADVVVHLAGMNRGEDAEVYDTNIALMKQLLDECDGASVKPYIIFSSSTHITRDTAYGRSKKEAGELLQAWAAQNSSVATTLVLPNVFGEEAQPHYNSAVATFCHELAASKTSQVNAEAQVTLIHAQEVALHIVQLISQPVNGVKQLDGTQTTIGEVYEKLRSYAEHYAADVVPAFSSSYETALFNTLRNAYYKAGFYPRKIAAKADPRGSLFEAVKQQPVGSQTFFSHTNPGFTRGNHYHARKSERFCVIQGTAEIAVRKLFSDTTDRFTVSSDVPVFIDMPTFYAHNITNIGSEDLITLFWVNEMFDPVDPDTFVETV